MSERYLNTEVQDSKEPLLNEKDFVVQTYDISDFYPRGAFRDQIMPPYPISDEPENPPGITDVFQKIEETNVYLADRFRQTILFELKYPSDSDEYDIETNTEKIATRKEPETIDERITLEGLREMFSYRDSMKHRFVKGDKIAILKHKSIPDSTWVVDLGTGKYKFLDRYYGESRPQKTQRQYQFSKLESEPQFEVIDLKEVGVKVAKDEGRKEKYPEETERFFSRMREADYQVEEIFINQIDTVITVSEAVQRFAKRVGRDKVRTILSDIRSGGWDTQPGLLSELQKDIIFARKLADKYQPIKQDEIKRGFELLFEAEAKYLGAVIDLSWNKVAPEPFDTLINVYWFRFKYRGLKYDWEQRINTINSFITEGYRKAHINRILRWAWEEHGFHALSIKELNEAGIIHNPKDVEKSVGSVQTFLDRNTINNKVRKFQKESRPSGLTKLLWKSLKWASPSTWKQERTILTSDFKYLDPDIWDEKIPDPQWLEIGDLLGRLTLPGESLPVAHPHIKTYVGSDIHKAFYQEADNYVVDEETEAQLQDNLNTIDKELTKIPEQTRSFRSITGEFQQVVSEYLLSDLRKKMKKLSGTQQMILLHRLGYGISQKHSKMYHRNRKFGKISISDFRPVKFMINVLYNGNTNQYYKEIERITKILKTKPHT